MLYRQGMALGGPAGLPLKTSQPNIPPTITFKQLVIDTQTKSISCLHAVMKKPSLALHIALHVPPNGLNMLLEHMAKQSTQLFHY